MSSADQLTNPRVESEFAALFERHRRELQVHCYRMLGSLVESEDLVQETFLRAWRKRASFRPDGPSSFRAWLYKIATNACLDVLRGRPRRLVPQQVAAAPGDPEAPPSPPADLPWLQPYPDRLLASISPEDEPDAVVVARETIELAFLRDPAPAAETAGGADPAGRSRLVREGHGFAARLERCLGEQRAAEGPSDAAGPPARAADGVDAVLGAE